MKGEKMMDKAVEGNKLRKGKKHGGKIKGDAPKMRADKRARGGRMTPASPLTGAGNMSEPSAKNDKDD